MKRYLPVVMLSLAAGLLLVACGSGGASQNGAAAGSSSTVQGAPAQGTKQTLTFFDWTSLENPTGQRLIQEYERLHPNVDIQISKLPPSSSTTSYVQAQLAGGTAADVMTLATTQQPWKDVKKGWWLDLTKYAMAPNPYVPGNKRWIDLLTPAAAKQLKFSDGKMYSMSTTGFDVGFFYNKDIFAKLGLSIPTTWTELFAAYDKVKAAGYIPLVFELGDHNWAAQGPSLITILEGTVMHDAIDRMDSNGDGTVDVKELVTGIQNGTYSARNADYQESWKLMKALSRYFQLGASAAHSADQGIVQFKTGRAATWFEGSFNSASLDATKIDWGAFQMPRLTSDTTPFATDGPQPTGGFGACCGYPWQIPASTQQHGKVELAVDFLYWLSKPENAQQFADGSGVVNMEKGASTNASLKPFADAASNVSPLAAGELSLPPQFIINRSRLVEEYITGTLSLSDAMAQMQKEMNTNAAAAVDLYGLDK